MRDPNFINTHNRIMASANVCEEVDSSGDETAFVSAILPGALAGCNGDSDSEEGAYMFEPWVQDWPECEDTARQSDDGDADGASSHSESGEEGGGAPYSRVGNTNWCKCGCCECDTLQFEIEHVCCLEKVRTRSRHCS